MLAPLSKRWRIAQGLLPEEDLHPETLLLPQNGLVLVVWVLCSKRLRPIWPVAPHHPATTHPWPGNPEDGFYISYINSTRYERDRLTNQEWVRETDGQIEPFYADFYADLELPGKAHLHLTRLLHVFTVFANQRHSLAGSY